MKEFVQKLLAWKIKKILAKYQPKVVAVTGSVGKTSTRNAIATVLSSSFRVRTTMENYNNEFGIPLTILGMKSPGRSLIGWAKVFWVADKLLLMRDPNFPNMLVLEYGADRPGDIAYLCGLAKPDVSVLTAISPVHVEFFDGLEGLKQEKGTILTHATSLAVLNADDAQVMSMQSLAKVPIVTYGMQDADVRARDVRVETRDDFSFEPGEEFSAIHFQLTQKNGEETPAVLHNMLGMGQVGAVLAATAVGEHFGMSVEEIASTFQRLEPQAGRMRPIAGIKGSLILDDSYNAAPASMRFAVDELARFSLAEGARRIAALGKMAELGDLSEQEHRLIGMKLAEIGADLVVTVGEPARDIRRGAIEAGIPEEHTQHFETSEEAGRYLDREIKKGDVVLVKGSQSARMEKVVKDLMAEPLRAQELLVRQSKAWVLE